MKSLLILILILGFSIINTQAQDRILEIKVGGTGPFSTSYLEFDSGYGGLGYSIEMHYYIKPKIAIGAFYSRSMDRFDLGDTYIINTNTSGMDGSFKFLSYGVSGKMSTNRARFFQAYAIARLYQAQNVYDFGDEFGFSVGDKGLAGGIGGGIVLKISRTIAFNLFEVDYNSFLSGMEFTKETFSPSTLEIKSGFLINLKERK